MGLLKNKTVKIIGLILWDILSIVFTFFIVLYIADGKNIFSYPLAIVYLVLVKIALYVLLKLYNVILDYIGIKEFILIVFGVVLSSIIVFLGIRIVKNILSVRLFILLIPMEICLLSLGRFFKRIIETAKTVENLNPNVSRKDINTLIIGAGSGGKLVLDEVNKNPTLFNKILAFVDDDPNKFHQRLNGVQILGPISEIHSYIDKYQIKEVIIGIANLEWQRLKEIIELVSQKDVKIKRLPLMTEMKGDSHRKIVDVDVTYLLNRGVITLDNEGIEAFIHGKNILVTGAGGSIGSELCEQILNYEPKNLIMFDIYENTTYETQVNLKKRITVENKKTILTVLIGSVYNEITVENLFKNSKPDIVFHASAYKHVPLMEDTPNEAVRTNVIGTYNVAKFAHKYNVEKMVLVSSDKAVRPTNIMGATKAVCEKIVQYFDSISKTNYSAVRFGNVLGSHGSVVPLFKKQIEDGGPVTITDPEITRYFMTISEAVSLILQSGVYAKGGEIFVLDMGEPVKIIDLATRMIESAGYRPGIDIKIEIIGLRPGEKKYEELLVDKEKHIKTANDKIFVEEKSKIEDVEGFIKIAKENVDKMTNDEIKELVRSLITSYHKE
ncbi:MAG: polysaccharide biosynthesis protein [Bacilli bacterium]